MDSFVKNIILYDFYFHSCKRIWRISKRLQRKPIRPKFWWSPVWQDHCIVLHLVQNCHCHHQPPPPPSLHCLLWQGCHPTLSMPAEYLSPLMYHVLKHIFICINKNISYLWSVCSIFWCLLLNRITKKNQVCEKHEFFQIV